MNNIRFPEMRYEVVEAVRALSDPDYQRLAWVELRLPPPQFDNFDQSIHILYDDTGVLEDPDQQVGVTLRSDREAAVMKRLAFVIDSMFDRVGTDLTDEAYMELPEWSLVVQVAREALHALTEEY